MCIVDSLPSACIHMHVYIMTKAYHCAGLTDENGIDNFVKEGIKMSRFRHPNVMRLIGICVDFGDYPCILMPYMTHGTLLSYLKKNRADLSVSIDNNTDLVRSLLVCTLFCMLICMQCKYVYYLFKSNKSCMMMLGFTKQH